MKSYLPSVYVCFGILLLTVSQGFSQENLLKWSPLKLAPSPVPLFAFHIGYEHILGENKSIGLTLKYYLPMNLQSFDVLFEENEDRLADGIFLSGSVNGYSIGPEFRFYKKGAPNGLYLLPFLRYFTNSGSGVMQYNPRNSIESSFIDGQFKFGGAGAGIGLGIQQVWNSGFLIDCNVGVGFLLTTLNLSGIVTGPISDERDLFMEDLSDAISTIPLVNVRLNNEGTQLRARTSGIFTPTIKSQLAIGYAF